ncbi:MAG TPA: hypothetical protein VN661_02015 [Candidatus Acidoferrales bacterium]|nr:hypothetical protein [Candidatus Acidoferrales bacterium]
MKRSTIVLAAICALALSFAMATMAQEAAKVAGNWEMSMSMGERNFTRQLTLQQDGGKITGTAKSQRGGEAKLEGTVDGNNIKFTITSQGRNGQARTQEYTGTVDGDSMKGTTTMNFGGNSNTANWTAKRSAAAASGGGTQ